MDEKLASLGVSKAEFENIETQRDQEMFQIESVIKKEISDLKEENSVLKKENENFKEVLNGTIKELLDLKSEVCKLKVKRSPSKMLNDLPPGELTMPGSTQYLARNVELEKSKLVLIPKLHRKKQRRKRNVKM